MADLSRTGKPIVSFVIATHNRRSVVAETLERVAACGLSPGQHQIVVVDNASTDGTTALFRAQPCTLLALDHNLGSCAKTLALGSVTGEFTVFLDDDSHPRPGSIERMIEHFEADARLGAAGFSVHLPSGAMESAALPGVFVGCGVGFRTSALREVGGPDRTFFMQAEEYDVSFRLASAGWRVEVFDDLHVDHMKSEQARRGDRTAYYDIRNNLRVLARYLPAAHLDAYRGDAIQRYRWIAERLGHERAYRRGLWAGRFAAIRERRSFRRHRLADDVFERFFRLREIETRMRGLAGAGVRAIALASLGKNVWAFVRGARRAGIEIAGVFDDRFRGDGRAYQPVEKRVARVSNPCPHGPEAGATDRCRRSSTRCYRGIRVLPMERIADARIDAVVISDMSPVHAERAARAVRGVITLDVHDWYGFDRTDAERGVAEFELPCGTGFKPVNQRVAPVSNR